MGEMHDKFAGRAKEIGGVATGNRQLESEGKLQYFRGKLKEGFERFKHALRREPPQENQPQP